MYIKQYKLYSYYIYVQMLTTYMDDKKKKKKCTLLHVGCSINLETMFGYTRTVDDNHLNIMPDSLWTLYILHRYLKNMKIF